MRKDDSAVDLALVVLKQSYVRGDIEVEEFDHRAAVVLGLHGDEAREDALSTAEYCEVTAMGDIEPQYLAIKWEWPP
jgi:hypothetical protein